MAVSLSACTGSGIEQTGTDPSGPGGPGSSSSSLGEGLEPCALDASWRCGTVTVPLDRGDPTSDELEIAFYVRPHSDPAAPVREPIFVTPGGPGGSGWGAKDPIAAVDSLTADHDLVVIDPRGTGASSAIDCEPLQSGFASLRELREDVAACGEQLGDDADRYGGGDVAMDVEAVRAALGVETFDYYAFSFATVDLQAYAARFPEHLHAVVLDSGFPAADDTDGFFWGLGVPSALVDVPALACERDRACDAGFPNAAADLWSLIATIGFRPLHAHDVDQPGIPGNLVVDQTAVAYLLASTPPSDLLDAAAAFRDGDPGPLMRLVQVTPPFVPGGDGAPTDFSTGDSAARTCNDLDGPWDRTDPPLVRERELVAALDALPLDAFAPFTKATWNDYWWLDMCLGWPSPDRFQPAVPPGAVFDRIPALILAGDLDTSVPASLSRGLLDELPDATFVVVRNAGHITLTQSTCAGELMTEFLDTLELAVANCAGPQPHVDR